MSASSGGVAPQLASDELVQPLGERLGEAVGERAGEDRGVVVVGGLELGDEARPARARRSPRSRRRSRRRPVSRGAVKSARARFGRPGGLTICWRSVWIVPTEPGPRLVRVQLDVVADAVRRPEADDRRSPGGDRSRDDPVEQRLRVVVERAGRRARATGSVEDRRVAPVAAPRSRRTASSRSGRRAPRAGGRRSSGRRGTSAAAASTPVQSMARRWRRASAIGWRAIFSSRAPRSRRSVSYSSRMPAANASRRSASRSAPATPTARDASATWTTGPWYCGSIFTAVWVRDVVAPPISSGSSKPSRSISPATWRISSSDGVISPDRPMRSASDLARRLEDPAGPGP